MINPHAAVAEGDLDFDPTHFRHVLNHLRYGDAYDTVLKQLDSVTLLEVSLLSASLELSTHTYCTVVLATRDPSTLDPSVNG